MEQSEKDLELLVFRNGKYYSGDNEVGCTIIDVVAVPAGNLLEEIKKHRPKEAYAYALDKFYTTKEESTEQGSPKQPFDAEKFKKALGKLKRNVYMAKTKGPPEIGDEDIKHMTEGLDKSVVHIHYLKFMG